MDRLCERAMKICNVAWYKREHKENQWKCAGNVLGYANGWYDL